jgi:hypothetical protein
MTTAPPLGAGVTGWSRPAQRCALPFLSPRFFDTLGRQKGLPGDAPGVGSHPAGRLGAPARRRPRRSLADALSADGVGRACPIGSVPVRKNRSRAPWRLPRPLRQGLALDPTQEGALTRVTLGAAGHACGVFPAMHGYSPSDPRVSALPNRSQQSRRRPDHPLRVLSVIRKTLDCRAPSRQRYGNPLELRGVALRHPSLPIIITSAGFRELLMGPTRANVMVDTSSSNARMKYNPA